MTLETIRTDTLPDDASTAPIYILPAQEASDALYAERTDRNIGWLTESEQATLKGLTIGIAGCGAIGGLVAQILHRSGIGRIKLADMDNFDITNINRQFSAGMDTVGKSKAFTTARVLRAIAPDTEIHVYPSGVTPESIDQFLEGCDLILDTIDYWALASRILLHRAAKARGITLMTGTNVGFGTRLFLFTPESPSVEKMCGITYEEALALEQKSARGEATFKDKIRVMEAVSIGLMPEFIEYTRMSAPCGNSKAIIDRMGKHGKGPVMSSNPPLVCGFLAHHVILRALKDSGIKRKGPQIPAYPGYLFLDGALVKARVRKVSCIRHALHTLKIKLAVALLPKHLLT